MLNSRVTAKRLDSSDHAQQRGRRARSPYSRQRLGPNYLIRLNSSLHAGIWLVSETRHDQPSRDVGCRWAVVRSESRMFELNGHEPIKGCESCDAAVGEIARFGAGNSKSIVRDVTMNDWRSSTGRSLRLLQHKNYLDQLIQRE